MKTETQTISRNQLIQNILKIGHKNLDDYVNLGIQAAREEAELFAHLIAWNFKKGEVRDSKVALPVLALRGGYDKELFENAVAHLVSLDPRNLVRAVEFSRRFSAPFPITPGAGNMLEGAVERYLRIREENPGWFVRSVLQHRKSMKALYALYHVKPSGFAQAILFKRDKPKGSVFEALANLRNMTPQEAAGTILNHKIPFLIASRAVGGIKNKPDVVMALIDQTSGAELITNTKMFQSLGVFDNPVLKAAYDAAMERAKKDKRVSSLKAGQAAKALEKAGDKQGAAKMKVVAESKMSQLGGIEGDWLVLGDCSGSMHRSIEIAKQVAAIIAQQVKGAVHLVFFNTGPYKFDVTGKSLEEIQAMTSRIRASGGTSIGCGLELIGDKGIMVNGIAICSDGGDNTSPNFHTAYAKYAVKMGIEPTVYHLWVPGDPNRLGEYCARADIQVQKFDVSDMDYYALPNLVKTLRTSKYSLVDEIMETPLLKLADVFSKKDVVA
jgi:hypothetical protein